LTYGSRPAPYLSIRTLNQCARDNAPSEEIARAIQSCFYIDDYLDGGDTVQHCHQKLKEVFDTLAAGKFPLTKISSNNPEVLTNIPEEKRYSAYSSNQSLNFYWSKCEVFYFFYSAKRSDDA
jgi:hypothetical protein